MKTFSVQTLGCRVNQYEGEQLAELLRARGLVPAAAAEPADLRVVHTCSVTVQAASKSRQAVRRATRLPVVGRESAGEPPLDDAPCDNCQSHASTGHASFDLATGGRSTALPTLANRDPSTLPAAAPPLGDLSRARVIVTGCCATSDPQEAASRPGVDAVLGHRGDDVAAELDRLLSRWQDDARPAQPIQALRGPPLEPAADDGWINEAGTPAGELTRISKSRIAAPVNEIPPAVYAGGAAVRAPVGAPAKAGFAALSVLSQRRQDGRQRAFLKVQDGCDAHCTYCIIPKLRPRLWSKPVHAPASAAPGDRPLPRHHGRCERYFSVTVHRAGLRPGDFVRARVTHVEPGVTLGEVVR